MQADLRGWVPTIPSSAHERGPEGKEQPLPPEMTGCTSCQEAWPRTSPASWPCELLVPQLLPASSRRVGPPAGHYMTLALCRIKGEGNIVHNSQNISEGLRLEQRRKSQGPGRLA